MSGRSSLRIRELKAILLERGCHTENKKSPWTSFVRGPPCSMCLWMHPTIPPVVGTSSLQAGLLAHGSSCSRAFPGHSIPSGMKRLQYPFTAAGPLLILTGFPINPRAEPAGSYAIFLEKVAPLVVFCQPFFAVLCLSNANQCVRRSPTSSLCKRSSTSGTYISSLSQTTGRICPFLISNNLGAVLLMKSRS